MDCSTTFWSIVVLVLFFGGLFVGTLGIINRRLIKPYKEKKLMDDLISENGFTLLKPDSEKSFLFNKTLSQYAHFFFRGISGFSTLRILHKFDKFDYYIASVGLNTSGMPQPHQVLYIPNTYPQGFSLLFFPVKQQGVTDFERSMKGRVLHPVSISERMSPLVTATEDPQTALEVTDEKLQSILLESMENYPFYKNGELLICSDGIFIKGPATMEKYDLAQLTSLGEKVASHLSEHKFERKVKKSDDSFDSDDFYKVYTD